MSMLARIVCSRKGEPLRRTREGLTAVILVKLPDPQFEGQTKNKLGNPEVRGYVKQVMNEYFAYYLDENPAIARKIIGKAILSARARKATRAARENVIRKAYSKALRYLVS